MRGAGQALRRRLQRYGVVYLEYHPRRHARKYRFFLVADPDRSCPVVCPVLCVRSKHSRALDKTEEGVLLEEQPIDCEKQTSNQATITNKPTSKPTYRRIIPGYHLFCFALDPSIDLGPC